MEATTADPAAECCPKESLRKSIYHRSASLTEVERTFLGALLLEGNNDEINNAKDVLNDEILFSLPIVDAEDDENRAEEREEEEKEGGTDGTAKMRRSNVKQEDLWRAHQDGVTPAKLMKKSSAKFGQSISSSTTGQNSRRKSRASMKSAASNTLPLENNDSNDNDVNSLDVQSDEEVGGIDHDSDASSWSENDGGFNHYDAWEVLRDEYASDFGFNLAVDDEKKVLRQTSADDDEERGIFKILGTSYDDTKALPHVLSPSLMDSLLNFVPDHLQYDNFWLKFSLLRDGASLDILKRYCRAATHTILAIETTSGDVFGSFTSTPWRTNNRYFGTGESFLWRMRHNRNTPVASLFDQAQLESEIDIFPYNGSNSYVQLCTSDKLALGGGGALKPTLDGQDVSLNQEDDAMSALSQGDEAVYLEWNDYGFGLALDQNLLHGSTSPSATFGNSALTNSGEGGQLFDVCNVEVWTLTSASTEAEAQKQEMSMFFVRQSISSLSKLSTSSATSPPEKSSSSLFSADDLNPETFYRRIGENDESEVDRDAWNYANMMNPGSQYGSRPMRGGR